MPISCRESTNAGNSLKSVGFIVKSRDLWIHLLIKSNGINIMVLVNLNVYFSFLKDIIFLSM